MTGSSAMFLNRFWKVVRDEGDNCAADAASLMRRWRRRREEDRRLEIPQIIMNGYRRAHSLS